MSVFVSVYVCTCAQARVCMFVLVCLCLCRCHCHRNHACLFLCSCPWLFLCLCLCLCFYLCFYVMCLCLCLCLCVVFCPVSSAPVALIPTEISLPPSVVRATTPSLGVTRPVRHQQKRKVKDLDSILQTNQQDRYMGRILGNSYFHDPTGVSLMKSVLIGVVAGSSLMSKQRMVDGMKHLGDVWLGRQLTGPSCCMVTTTLPATGL